MSIGKFLKRGALFVKHRYAPRGTVQSFTSTGEDLIILSALQKFGVTRPTYIDIGAHHPIFSNNTYLLYRHGGNGVIFEPNKELCTLAARKRPHDICICAGAGPTDTESTFYNFPQSTRSTFSKEQAEEWQKNSGQKPSISNLPIFSLDTIVAKFLENKTPDVISIDAEGYDMEIMRGFSWNVRPRVFCIESATQDIRNRLQELFEKNKYAEYARTPANTIFIDTLIQ